jgi:uncharacterized cupredoxin-like copper-binding protein
MEGTLTVKEGANQPGQATPGAQGSPQPETEQAAAQPLSVDLVDIAFSPPDISVKANEPTKVNLTNKGLSDHTFTVKDLGIDEKLAPGEQKQITINASAGNYEIICEIPGHAAAGMVGKLTVD